MSASKAMASDPVAADAAQRVLDAEGTAADAAIAGFLAAAGAHEGVLFAPTVALIGGIGFGARLLDGRAVQPGAGVKRPRGLQPGETVPEAARAAVPRSLALLALLHVYGAKRPMNALARFGIAEAKRAEAPGRQRALDSFARRGAAVLGSADLRRQLLLAASSTQGGILTETDLEAAHAGDEVASFVPLGARLEGASPSWEAPAARRRAQIIVSADTRGSVVAFSYVPDDEGVEIPELALRLPRDAEPVRRSVPRIAPGTPRPAPAPIALLRRQSDGWFAAIGVTGGNALDLGAFDPAAPLSAQLTALVEARMGRPALAASTQRRKTAASRAE